jgi:hypothetical protein
MNHACPMTASAFFNSLLVAAPYLDLKWIVAIGFAAVIASSDEIGGRLYDLCIRTRRATIQLQAIADRIENSD